MARLAYAAAFVAVGVLAFMTLPAEPASVLLVSEGGHEPTDEVLRADIPLGSRVLAIAGDTTVLVAHVAGPVPHALAHGDGYLVAFEGKSPVRGCGLALEDAHFIDPCYQQRWTLSGLAVDHGHGPLRVAHISVHDGTVFFLGLGPAAS